jgi:hypothetical protein
MGNSIRAFLFFFVDCKNYCLKLDLGHYQLFAFKISIPNKCHIFYVSSNVSLMMATPLCRER